MAEEEKFRTLEIVQKDPSSLVFHLFLNLPHQRNALTPLFFSELPAALSLLDLRRSAAAVVLAGRGPHFCAGLHLSALRSPSLPPSADPGRAREALRRKILSLQAAISAVEACRRPVIAAVHGGCIGAGLDLAAACDIRYCTEDAFFCVKEVDLALAADLGVLQRLPGIVGRGVAAELALTGRRVSGREALALGLVSAVFPDRDAMDAAVELVARDIASKSPLAVTGTKAILLRSRDLTVEQGLDYVATWNSAMLISHDLDEAVSAQLEKKGLPTFSKL